MRVRAKQARYERKAWGSKVTENASAKREAQESKATKNASEKNGVQGSEATKNLSAKTEGAKQPSRPTELAFFAFLCVSVHFDSIETHIFFKKFCERKAQTCLSKASKMWAQSAKLVAAKRPRMQAQSAKPERAKRLRMQSNLFCNKYIINNVRESKAI